MRVLNRRVLEEKLERVDLVMDGLAMSMAANRHSSLLDVRMIRLPFLLHWQDPELVPSETFLDQIVEM